MNIKFIKDWTHHKAGVECWISDSAGARLVKEGYAEVVVKKPKASPEKDKGFKTFINNK